MSDTAYEGRFGDGTYRFWLGLPQVVEIERVCGQRMADGTLSPKSLFAIFDEIGAGLAEVDGKPLYVGGSAAIVRDIREVIRQGLIGGGEGSVDGSTVEVGPTRASELLDAYVFPSRPLVEGAYLAWAILNAAINGIVLKKKADAPASARKRRKPSSKAS